MIEVTTYTKKAPADEGAFKGPGESVNKKWCLLTRIVPGGPDGRVVREVFLPNRRKDIEAGPLGEGVVLPRGCVVVLYVGDGNRMDRFTARLIGRALAPCSYIQVQGEDIGPSFSDAHYLYGLEAILHGIREIAAEEAAELRDWEVPA